MKKECLLYDRICSGCGECDMCDLDPSKKCENCGNCIDECTDYRSLNIEAFEKMLEDREEFGKKGSKKTDRSKK